ncbi:MAG: PmbA/TldA family metallopeptidase, partial [bacterium]
MLDRLEDLLKRARAQGAVEADAFMVEEEIQTIQVRLGQIESLKHARETRCSLRIFTPTGSASATSSDVSSAALGRLIDETLALARVTERDEHSGLPFPNALARDLADLDLSDRDGHALPIDAKIEQARRAEAAAMEADPRVRNSEGAEFYDRQGRVAYAASGGFAGRFPVSSFAISVT